MIHVWKSQFAPNDVENGSWRSKLYCKRAHGESTHGWLTCNLPSPALWSLLLSQAATTLVKLARREKQQAGRRRLLFFLLLNLNRHLPPVQLSRSRFNMHQSITITPSLAPHGIHQCSSQSKIRTFQPWWQLTNQRLYCEPRLRCWLVFSRENHSASLKQYESVAHSLSSCNRLHISCTLAVWLLVVTEKMEFGVGEKSQCLLPFAPQMKLPPWQGGFFPHFSPPHMRLCRKKRETF